MGLLDEAKKNGAVLGYNYPGDRWYSDAYALLTSKGLRPATIPTVVSKRSVFHTAFTKDKTRTVGPPVLGTTAAALASAHPDAAAKPDAAATPAKPDADQDAAPPKKKKRRFFHIPFPHDKSGDVTQPDTVPTPVTPTSSTPTS